MAAASNGDKERFTQWTLPHEHLDETRRLLVQARAAAEASDFERANALASIAQVHLALSR